MKSQILILLLISFGFFLKGQAQYNKVCSHGVDIYYRIFGTGIPILIVGGGPGDNSDRYLSLCNLLSLNHQCILVDQRGTGKSIPEKLDSTTITVDLTIQDFETIRKELGLSQWTVLGFSFGGFLASCYAECYPRSISSLILLGSMGLNTAIFGYFFDNVNSRLCLADKEQFRYWNDSSRIAENPHHALVERIRAIMPAYFFDREKSLVVSQEIKDNDFNFMMGELIWNDIKKKKVDLSSKKSTFGKPVLILQGRQDPVGESVPQLLSQYYQNSTLIFIEQCGHYSWVEQPEKVTSIIHTFMLSQPSR